MKEMEDNIDMAEKFLNGQMTEDERISFENRLAIDPSLSKLVEDMGLMIEGIRLSAMQTSKDEKTERLQFFAEIMEIEQQDDETQQNKVIPLYRNKYVWAMAAAVVICSLAFLFWTRNPEPRDLFAASFEPYPNVFEPTVRGTESPQDIRSSAFRAYDRGDYKEATHLFSTLLAQKKEAGLLLLDGNANLALGNTEEAQNDFLTLIKDFDELDAQAKWYLGLTYLKKGDTKKARLIFQQLEKPEFNYSEKAETLLNSLPNN